MTCLTLPVGLLSTMALGVLLAALAPGEISFLGAAVIAVVWCRWLDAHAETLPEEAPDRPVPQELFRTSLASAQGPVAIVEER